MIPKKDIDKLKKKQKEATLSKVLNKIAGKFTKAELRAIANSSNVRVMPGMMKVPVISFSGQKIKFGAITDTQLGAIYAAPEWIEQAFKVCKREGCEFLTHCGDVTEGMINARGHVFELTHLGYDAQRDHSVEVFNLWDKPIYMIDGNHDQWYTKNINACIVEDICSRLKHAVYLGEDEGDISLKGKAILKLWHGKDGNSYAISYRPQKIVESLTGGEKPGMIIAGHTHKQLYMFDRHIHVLSAGAMCKQSKWMRGKRIANHSGFHIVELQVNKSGICRCKIEWFPFYA